MVRSLTEEEANWVLDNIRSYKENMYMGDDYKDALGDWDITHFDDPDEEEFELIKSLYEKLYIE